MDRRLSVAFLLSTLAHAGLLVLSSSGSSSGPPSGNSDVPHVGQHWISVEPLRAAGPIEQTRPQIKTPPQTGAETPPASDLNAGTSSSAALETYLSRFRNWLVSEQRRMGRRFPGSGRLEFEVLLQPDGRIARVRKTVASDSASRDRAVEEWLRELPAFEPFPTELSQDPFLVILPFGR